MSDHGKIIGFDELQRKLRNPTWASGPAGRFLDMWRFHVERGAKANIKRGIGGWLWHGNDRRSLTSERDHAQFPLWARVGSNSKSIRWGEFGTGLLSEDPQSAKRRYFPPPAALDKWAIAHGFHTGSASGATAGASASPGTYGYLVARMIWQQGGTKPRRFLRNAVKDAEPKIAGWLSQAAKAMEVEASRGVV